MRARRRGDRVYYYYDTGEKPRREIPLGSDYVLAVQQWAKLNISKPTVSMTVAWAIGKYLASNEFESVSAGTQDDYRMALEKILAAFGDAPLYQVRPSHVVLYIEKRGKESMHRAQRERAVFSMLYRWCMARDYCKFNPVSPVKGKRLPGRKHIDISDAMLNAVYEQAGEPLREAIDLAYFIGQRPADLRAIYETDIKDNVLSLRQGKTGTPLRFQIVGGLADLIERIRIRKAGFPVRSLALLVDEKGAPMTKAKLRSRFEIARAAAGIAGKDFQFRDMRRKSGTDLRDQEGLDAAQDLLGHKTRAMTEHYTGARGKIRSAIPQKAASNKGE